MRFSEHLPTTYISDRHTHASFSSPHLAIHFPISKYLIYTVQATDTLHAGYRLLSETKLPNGGPRLPTDPSS